VLSHQTGVLSHQTGVLVFAGRSTEQVQASEERRNRRRTKTARGKLNRFLGECVAHSCRDCAVHIKHCESRYDWY